MEPSFRDYQSQVLKNAKAMAEALPDRRYDLVSGLCNVFTSFIN